MKPKSFYSSLLFFITLMTFWVIMSGHLDPLHLGMGVGCVIIVMALHAKVRRHNFFSDERDDLNHLRLGNFVLFVFWMLWQILLSGIQVARIILTRGTPPETCIVTFKVNLPSAHARMILGNSITLTPGTLTLSVDGNDFVVHALSGASYGGIVDDSMPRKVLGLFSAEDRPVISEVKIIGREGMA